MNNRPPFTEIKSFEEFSKYYWYREELQKICLSLGIDANGMKAELNHNIKEYFKGNIIHTKGATITLCKPQATMLSIPTDSLIPQSVFHSS